MLFVGLLFTGVTVNAEFAVNWPEYTLANVGVVLLVLRSSRWVLTQVIPRAR